MKAAEGFIYKQMHGRGVIVPVGAASQSFNGMVTLNETGSFLWERIQADVERDALIQALLAEYDTDEATAARDVDAFLTKLREAGLLVE